MTEGHPFFISHFKPIDSHSSTCHHRAGSMLKALQVVIDAFIGF
jgi:hypothetical protein